MHFGFYSTTLDVLLEDLHVKTLILTAAATNICMLFTPNDAYMRDFKLHIPRDCVAANSAEETNYALGQMKSLLKADICPSDEIDFRRLGVRPSELGGGK